MHHFTAHELADAWELRAGLTDASAWDRAAAVAACLRECAAELRSAATPQPEAQPGISIPAEIAKIIENLHTQDNRITANPLFAVQQKRVIGGLESGYEDGWAWVDSDGEPYLRWHVEGGIYALPEDATLVFPHQDITDDDGSGEVYLVPPAVQHGKEQP